MENDDVHSSRSINSVNITFSLYVNKHKMTTEEVSKET